MVTFARSSMPPVSRHRAELDRLAGQAGPLPLSPRPSHLTHVTLTGWMGVVGMFILLCVCPVLSSLLLSLAAVACCFLFGRPRWDLISKGPPRRD